MSALDDTRTLWPHAPGTAAGPRLAKAMADAFAAGDSIAAIAHWYEVPEDDVALAVRVVLRGYVATLAKIVGALGAFDAPLEIGAAPDTPPADKGFGE